MGEAFVLKTWHSKYREHSLSQTLHLMIYFVILCLYFCICTQVYTHMCVHVLTVYVYPNIYVFWGSSSKASTCPGYFPCAFSLGLSLQLENGTSIQFSHMNDRDFTASVIACCLLGCRAAGLDSVLQIRIQESWLASSPLHPTLSSITKSSLCSGLGLVAIIISVLHMRKGALRV